MKLFKILIYLLLVSAIIISIYSICNSFEYKITAASEKSDFYLQVEHGLKIAQIEIVKNSIRDYQNQYEFYIINDSNPTKIIFSTQKNPYWQITSLQEILKTAKINNKQIQLIDLSIRHPYATFKNN